MSETTKYIGDLEIQVSCRPNPVRPSGTKHLTRLHNTGYDTYYNITLVVRVRPSNGPCSIGLSSSTPLVTLGALPRGARRDNSVDVVRIPTGTNTHERIAATVQFFSESESDPLYDDPTAPHVETIEITVTT
jgi:hypothetical protein